MARQNVYDNPEFFAGYRNLRDNLVGLHENVIQPAMPRLVSDEELRDARVLDLGCGEGWFTTIALERGARTIVGVDPSALMLERARASIVDPRVSFVHTFAEDAFFEADSFDLVASVLALHYVEDYTGVVAAVARWLAPRGLFAFIVEHPIGTCQRDMDWIEEDGRTIAWPVYGYHDEGERQEHWYVDGVVKYHRTVETYVNTLVQAGLVVERLIEPAPTREAVELAGRGVSGLIRPDVLGIRAVKPG
jgi:SAM-dependent methyltransferase